jgi:ParB family chromosome partitioning protein
MVKEIPLSKIETGKSQARTRRLEENIDELAESINRVGLLEPVVVYELDGGKYELLTGQRRVLAVTKLGWEKIEAKIVERPANPAFAKAISLTENFVRNDLPTADLIDACTALYRHYGSIDIVAQETGLSKRRIREYVKSERLIPELKKMLEDQKIELPVALKAQDAATSLDGSVDEPKALQYAATMKSMAPTQRKTLVAAAEADPEKTAEEVIEEARRPPKQVRMTVTLLQETATALDKFAAEEKTSREDAAIDLIDSGLKEKGYQ